jgi:hypothetical protein
MTTTSLHSLLRRSLSTRPLLALLSGSALALVCSSLLMPGSAHAADYCHTDDDGDYVCIQTVFGPRSNRGLVYTVNGNVYATRINCYHDSYNRTSIAAVACWSYNA